MSIEHQLAASLNRIADELSRQGWPNNVSETAIRKEAQRLLKPEPREWTVDVLNNGRIVDVNYVGSGHNVIRVREVIE